MKIGAFIERSGSGGEPPHSKGSALIIVMWVAFGLVALALYFGEAMSMELRGADNRVAALEAEQAIAGAACYVTNVLSKVTEPGLLPDTNTYRFADLPIGDARAWFIGRSDRQNFGAYNAWGLVDEGSKMNLNVVTEGMLSNLVYIVRNMTPEIAASMIDWRDADEEPLQGGVESDYYMRLNPAYRAKNTNYESVAELRMVAGMDLSVLLGEDENLNGVLDRNENDSESTVPFDNGDGRLDPGLIEYFTVYTRIPTVGTNVNDQTNLLALLQTKLGQNRAQEIAGAGQSYSNLLHFFFQANLTRDEMRSIEGFLVCTNATNALININTAPEAVLTCIPGIGTDFASQIIAFRQSNGQNLNTLAWIKEATNWTLENDRARIIEVGNWICGRAFQLSADIAAVGHHGRGYKRVKYVFDVADGYAQTRSRQDLTYMGWALGRNVREALLASKK